MVQAEKGEDVWIHPPDFGAIFTIYHAIFTIYPKIIANFAFSLLKNVSYLHPMKVLLVNTSEQAGGAAIAANRLLKALGGRGVKASMLVRDRSSVRPEVISPVSKLAGKIKFMLERFDVFLANRFHTANLFAVDPATQGFDITQLPEYQEADLIHLHWVNQGMLSISDLQKIIDSGKPIVWTLHDMWPCTGICHQAADCKAWTTGCGHCPLLWGEGSKKDLSWQTFRKKEKLFDTDRRIRFVACSNWLSDIARQSPLLKRHSVESIPNAIDTQFFAPGSKKAARMRLGLPLEKRILLFVAYKATDKNKGIDYLREAIEHIRKQSKEWVDQLCVVPVGREADTLKNSFACEARPQNYVSSEDVMRDLYNAADLLLMPTLMDNLPNTIVEAMACGVPCVGFNVGGLPQMITHGKDGYLAKFKNAEDFAIGIMQTLFTNSYQDLSRAARKKAVDTYSEEAIASRYIEVYREAIASRQKQSY